MCHGFYAEKGKEMKDFQTNLLETDMDFIMIK